MILRARYVLPVSRPVIEDGAVAVSRGRILRVGRWRDAGLRRGGRRLDLGDAVLIPGLVNAHCHLDYTDMAGCLRPQHSFPEWIKSILSLKLDWTLADYEASWKHGAEMLLRTGTTTVGDIEAAPDLLPGVWQATPLRIISFIEMTGVRGRRLPEIVLGEVLEKASNLRSRRCGIGLAPHAPYSTVPQLLRHCARTARRKRWPLSIHVAESRDEFQMFTEGRGPMFDWLKRNERDMSDCGMGSPVQHLESLGCLSPRVMAVHANYLAPGDARLLARRRVSVAHCPRSHAYFRHEPFPGEELSRAGVNVCLGTDSLATVLLRGNQPLELNMFAEMRAFAKSNPWAPPELILRMASLHGARALGLRGQVGVLAAGARADLVVVPAAGPIEDVPEAVVQSTHPPRAVIIGGRFVVPPQRS